MTKNFSTSRFLLGVATWAQETTSPKAGAGVAAQIGSFWQRNGTVPATPTETYLKTSSVDTGWTKQNTINLNVYNVRDYGALGDGVTNDTAAIQAAINAANSAGGGFVYFPATAQYYSIVKRVGASDIIDLASVTNVTLMGDGYASKIRQTGSAGNAETHMFGVRNNAARIRFVNLYLDGNLITSPDPARQNHGIQVYSTTAAGVAPTDVEIVGCYFGVMVGDAIRFLGAAGKILTDVRVESCALDLGGSSGNRSGISVQRNAQKIIIRRNWITGCHGNDIDFEPTTVAPPDAGSPAYFTIFGNIFDHFDLITDTITLSRSWFSSCSYNILNNATSISGVNLWYWDIRGNILDWGGDNAQYGIDLQTEAIGNRVTFNIVNIPTQTNNRRGISVQSGSGNLPARDLVFGNLVRVPVVTGQGGILNGTPNGVTSGNLIDLAMSAGGIGFGMTIGGPHTCEGNLTIARNAQCEKIVVCTTGGGPGVSTNHNVGVGSFLHGCQFNNPGPYPSSMAKGNVAWGTTSNFIEEVTAPSGIGSDGNAGPASLVAEIELAAGPSGVLAAGIGSLCTSVLSNQNRTFFYKDGGTPFTNTQWAAYGETDITMGAASGSTATANRFFAPGGMALATETTVEIQWAVPRPCRIRNLRVRNIAGVGGGNNTYRVRKNGVDTALQCTIANNVANGSDTTNSFTAVAGDLISLRVAKTAAPAAPQTNIIATMGVI